MAAYEQHDITDTNSRTCKSKFEVGSIGLISKTCYFLQRRLIKVEKLTTGKIT